MGTSGACFLPGLGATEKLALAYLFCPAVGVLMLLGSVFRRAASLRRGFVALFLFAYSRTISVTLNLVNCVAVPGTTVGTTWLSLAGALCAYLRSAGVRYVCCLREALFSWQQ